MSFSSFNNLAELARNGGFKLIEGQSVACDSIDWRFIGSVHVFIFDSINSIIII